MAGSDGRPSSNGPPESSIASSCEARQPGLTRPPLCLRCRRFRKGAFRHTMASYSGTYDTSPRRGAPLRGSGWHRLGNTLKTTVLLAGLTALVLLIGQKL